MAVGCDVTEWDQQEAMVARALEHFGRIDVVFANAGLRRRAGISEGVARVLALDGADERLRGRADDPRHANGGEGGPRPLHPDRLGRRPPGAPGLAVLGHEVGGDGMGEALRQELNDTGVRVTLIEPGMVDTPFFEILFRRLAARGRGAGGDVRRVAAGSRRRQRDPRQADGAGQLKARAAGAAREPEQPSQIRGDDPCLLGDLRQGVANDREPRGAQLKIARMVALELRRRAMAAIAVELDHHPAVDPDRIDEPPLDHHVDRGDRDAMAFAKTEERVLELAASAAYAG